MTWHKNSQLRLSQHQVQLTVAVPSRFLEEVIEGVYQGIFISNGPGDPRSSYLVINQLGELITNRRIVILEFPFLEYVMVIS